jgi:uncharacterized protein (DUF1330 family)
VPFTARETQNGENGNGKRRILVILPGVVVVRFVCAVLLPHGQGFEAAARNRKIAMSWKAWMSRAQARAGRIGKRRLKTAALASFAAARHDQIPILVKEHHMAAYLVARLNVTDWEKFSEYQKSVPATIASHGGRYLARGGEMITFEGEKQPERTVLIEFPSLQRAREWYLSDEYQRLKKLRLRASTGTLIIVEGC